MIKTWHFDHKLKLTLTTDENFIRLRTYDVHHGKSGNFYIRRCDMTNWLLDPVGLFIDRDCSSFIAVSKVFNELHVEISWLNSVNAHDDLSGYRQHFTVPVPVVKELLTDVWEYADMAALANEIRHISFDELVALGPNAERMCSL